MHTIPVGRDGIIHMKTLACEVGKTAGFNGLKYVTVLKRKFKQRFIYNYVIIFHILYHNLSLGK